MEDFLLFASVGFVAQMVDGALGMAYGVISSTVLLAFGVPPASASASVHFAEMATTAVSGSSHIAARNVDWKLFARVAPAGIIGGFLGAYVLTGVDGDVLRPYITAYLGAMGSYILWRGIKGRAPKPLSPRLTPPLGVAGGFADAVGGGGWGPIVTSTLMASGGEPRRVIGTVNTAEFFVTTAISASFFIALLSGHWEDAGDLTQHGLQIGGLIAGGVVAAPLAGFAVSRIKPRPLMLAVGTLVVLISSYQAARIFGWL